jgi:hypothetical protein
LPGLVVGCVDGVDLPFGVLGSVVSCAIAWNSRLACGCSQITRFGSVGSAPFGAVTNWTDWLVSPRRSPASDTRALNDSPSSVVSALAVSCRTEYSLV